MNPNARSFSGSTQPLFHGPDRSSPRGWAALLVVLCLMACKRTPAPEEPKVADPVGTSLFLELKSAAGQAVSGAVVRVSSGGNVRELKADDRGQLLLEQLEGEHHLLEVQAPGFDSTLMPFALSKNAKAGAQLELRPETHREVFDASVGIPNLSVGNVDLEIPPDSLFDERHQPIRGEVEVSVTALDLNQGELSLAPGLMEGVVPGATEPVGLEVLGILKLRFTQNAKVIPFAKRIKVRGQPPGSVRINSVPAPGPHALSTQLSHPLPRVPAWRLDPGTGRWLPTMELGYLEHTQGGGTAWTVTVDNPQPVISVALPFWWRSIATDNPLQVPADPQAETACIEVVLMDEQDQPVAGHMVLARSEEYSGLSRGMTDENGQVVLRVMRDRAVTLVAAEGIEEVVTVAELGTCGGQQRLVAGKPRSVRLNVARACAPGAMRDCAYSGPRGTAGQGVCRAGWQYCGFDGARWSGTCQGEVTPRREECGDDQDDDCDGTLNEACASVCEEGAEEACDYDGLAGMAGVGVCKAGTRQCVAGGTGWSVCSGQVLPGFEVLSNSVDEDCNGVVSMCWPGEMEQCAYSGPSNTQGQGNCRAGTRTCNEAGTAWSACTGEVTPQPQEDCTTASDDDCDGEVNEPSYCICTPNDSRSCYGGPEGTAGVGECKAGTQACNPAGTEWSACMGEVLPQAENCANTVDDNCNGQLLDGPGCVCVPGTDQPCYSGPSNTRGEGLCQDGTQSCDPSGMAWGACTGDVTPQPQEVCTTAGDDDCDGEANEPTYCICAPNDSRSCYTGPAGTSGVGVCQAGTEVCNPAGTEWSSCTGEVTPQTETCGNAVDEDCDGQLTDSPNCICVPGTSQSCYSGPTGTQGVGVCVAGSRTCNALGTEWGACTGEVLPRTETCGNAVDENCSGQANEKSACGGWASASSMSTGRVYHTATVLPNGKVLVAGGADSNTRLASAQVYDPVSNTWGPSTSMSGPRQGHRATLLPNGKVLVTGGENESYVALNSAELYDPVNNSWTTVASMNLARRVHAAILLPDGKVLVSGGQNSTLSTDTAEVYDPGNNSWLYTSNNLSAGRFGHSATLLNNGKVLVVGGEASGGIVRNSAELYNPTTNTWSPAPPMSSARNSHTAMLLPDGRVLVAGGRNTAIASSSLNTVEVYDPANNTWSAAASMITDRYYAGAVLLPNGQVLVAGGRNAGVLNTVERYNPATNEWLPVEPMDTVRQAPTASLLPDGRVFIVGGHTGGTGYTNTAALYEPPTSTWLPTSNNLDSPRNDHAAVLLTDGKLLVTGGNDGASSVATAELYNPTTNSWALINDGMSASRDLHTATRLLDGKVLIVGGRNGGTVLNSGDLYNADAGGGTFDPISNSMLTARYLHTATLLSDGKVLVAGGRNGGGSLDVAEVYDPTAGSWVATSNTLLTARTNHTATRLNNGKVLVVGGNSNGTVLNTAELYVPATGDPATDAWTAVNNVMATPRHGHIAVLLPSGKVLIAGGFSGSISLNTAEVFDPANNSWSLTNNTMLSPRNDHSAILLPNGQVLISGGKNGNTMLGTSELYDPATNTWFSTSSTASPRQGHTATVLPNGRVIIVGGLDDTTPLDTAELYEPPTRAWMSKLPMIFARHWHTATRLNDGKVLVVAGTTGGFDYLATAETYDPSTGTWSVTNSPMATVRDGHTATLLNNGKVLVTGGERSLGIVVDTAEVYDPSTGTWSVTNTRMATARDAHTATRLNNGKVLVVGGESSSGTYLASAELYDPETNTWSLVAPMSAARSGHTATRLPDGKVLIAGGHNSTFSVTPEVYDPVLNSWTSTSNALNDSRYGHTATLLPSGKVLLMGGKNGSYIDGLELYDPATNGWAPAPTLAAMPVPRFRPTATLLPNGKVLVVGGDNATGFLPTFALYDPVANTWSSGTQVIAPRFLHTATLLGSKVLIIGGYNNGIIDTVDEYTP